MDRRLSKNTLILLVSNGGSAVLSFLIAVLIGRFYGEGGLGIYASVLAWIYPLSFIVEFGFGTMITRDVAQQSELAHDYLRITWQFRLITGGIIILFFCLIALIWADNPLTFIISSPLIIILPAYSAYTAVFRAHQRMSPIAMLNLSMLLSQVILLIAAVVGTAHLIVLFVINTITSLAQLVAAMYIYRTHFYNKSKSRSDLTLFDLIRQARSFAIAGIISAFQARFSILWLETVSTPITVGLFVASLRFIDGAKMVPNALFGAVYPAFSSLADNTAKLHRLFRLILFSLGTYGIIIAITLFGFADTILVLSFGDTFVAAQSALITLGFMLIPFFLRSGWILYWYATAREKAVNIILVINLILLIIIPSGMWILSIGNDPLVIITQAMLYTECITLFLLIIGDVTRWQRARISPTA